MAAIASSRRIVRWSHEFTAGDVKCGNQAHNPTELQLAWGRGETGAFDKLVPFVHAELRRLARRYMLSVAKTASTPK